MAMNKEYRAAVAFINFDRAYTELADATAAMGDDFDVTECYPFYLLDFEEIAPAVKQWATLQARALLNKLPDRICNPACLVCEDFCRGVYEEGLCKHAAKKRCINSPVIQFSKEAVLPYMRRQQLYDPHMTDAELEFAYMGEVERHT